MLGFICGLELEKIEQHRSEKANQELRDPIEEKLQPLVSLSTIYNNIPEQMKDNEKKLLLDTPSEHLEQLVSLIPLNLEN